MITERTPVDLGASLVAPLCGDHPALSVVGGSVAGANLGRRVISPVVGDRTARGACPTFARSRQWPPAISSTTSPFSVSARRFRIQLEGCPSEAPSHRLTSRPRIPNRDLRLLCVAGRHGPSSTRTASDDHQDPRRLQHAAEPGRADRSTPDAQPAPRPARPALGAAPEGGDRDEHPHHSAPVHPPSRRRLARRHDPLPCRRRSRAVVRRDAGRRSQGPGALRRLPAAGRLPGGRARAAGAVGGLGGELFERGVPVARKRRPGRPRKDDHLDKRAAERALADRLAGLDLELDQLLATDRLTSGSDADSATRGDDGVAA